MNEQHHSIDTNYTYKRPKTLLTTENSKTVKGEKLGYKTFILYMSPARQWFGQGHKLNNKNLCPQATKGCELACLFTAGRGRFSNVMIARKRKSEYYLTERKAFIAQLFNEIKTAVIKYQDKAVFRLNGTTDIQWENIKHEGKTLMDWFPNNQFYDYTKIARRFEKQLPKNYFLVYSYAETKANQTNAWNILKQGHNIAAVFSVKNETEFPTQYNGFQVVNGDEHDAIFTQPKGTIIALKAKGQGKKDTSGFVIHV